MATSGFQAGKLLRIFLDDNDRTGVEPTYAAVAEFLRRKGVSGATVFRGIEGFGSHSQMHASKVFSWLPNLPILIEVIDDWAKLEPLVDDLRKMIGEGLLTVEDVEYSRIVHPKTLARSK
ncbi:MAG: DUF190 domain-containing protein [Candidatus Baltobacteraceae bacterium]|jgi:hypothetical protein